MTTEPQRAPAIDAPDVVVDSWRKEYGRAVHAANRPLDPALREPLNRTPREVRELVVLMSEALRHAGGIFLASVSNAIPDAAALFAEGLEALAKEVAAEQAGQTGGEEAPCPLPKEDGTEMMCTCGPEEHAACSSIAFDIGAGRIAHGVYPVSSNTMLIADELTEPTAQGDDGCEGGVR